MNPEFQKTFQKENDLINHPAGDPEDQVELTENNKLVVFKYQEPRKVLSFEEAEKRIDEAKSLDELKKVFVEIGVLKGEEYYPSEVLIKIIEDIGQKKAVIIPETAGLNDKVRELAFREWLVKNRTKFLRKLKKVLKIAQKRYLLTK
jgi:hypothetical protein